MVLARHASLSAEGLVDILGAGWMVRPPDAETAGPMAIAIFFSVPRDELGDHTFRLALFTVEGEAAPPADPLRFEGPFTVEGIASKALQVPVTSTLVLQLGFFPLASGQQYEWRLHIDGRTRKSWRLGFRTTPP